MEEPSHVPSPGLPGQAPPLLWVLVIAAALIWWLLPWFDRWQASRSAPAPAPAEERVAAASTLHQDPELSSEDEAISRPELSFDVAQRFQELFAESCALLSQVLAVPPTGERFTQAAAGLLTLAKVLDRAFTEEKTQLKGTAFETGGVRPLAEHAGFKLEEGHWVLDLAEPLVQLRGLTVRLCLQRSSELQRLRGTHRWAQSDNTAVVPGAARLPELLELYRNGGAEGEKPSLRERNVEAEVKVKMQERRAEQGCCPLGAHESLALAARQLAQQWRVRERQGQPRKPRRLEVEELLGKLPLPPGFSATQLYFRSTELPSIFGLTSSTGARATPMGGRSEEKDAAAEILAREACGLWAARQVERLAWPSACLCGVGAALDYTVNRGFIVALLIGFEGVMVEEVSEQKTALQELRRRQAAAASEAAKASPSTSFGARVRTLGSSSDAVLNRK